MDMIGHPEIRYVVPPVDMNGVATGHAPRKRHDVDCGHFTFDGDTVLGSPQLATEEQMRDVPPCRDCVSRTASAERESQARAPPAPPPGRCARPALSPRPPSTAHAIPATENLWEPMDALKIRF